MAQERQGLSRTLPKSFTFSSIESSFPRTPEHPRIEPQIPPPPRHSSYRVRRPRFDSHASIFSTMSSEPNIFDLSRPDVPVPSIEFPVSDTMSEPDTTAYESVSSEFLQVPALRRMEFKTPPAQIRTEPFNFPRATPDPTEDAEDDPIERPSSRASDSSVSSIETYTTQPSLGGSCTSPESEIYDPFSFQLTDTNKYVLETPPSSNPNRGKSADLPKRKARWTADMDNHLWNTYQMYLQDPTTTPFKTLPGSLPPLGVSHRVAREAKKTWVRLKSRKEQEPVKVVPVSISADDEQSITPAEDRSGSCTPTAKKPALPRWPRSEAATRRRLKFLCKRKLSIAPHYQRLLQSRSPSPFLDVFTAPPRRPVGPAIDHNSSTTFMTRDLGVSLVSSSLPTDFANFGAVETPTIQLAPPVETIETMQSPQQASNPPTSVIPSHVPTVQEPFPRLGSPFMYNTWGPETSRREAHSAATRGLRRDTIHVAGSRLRSPPRMDLPSSVHKRRAHHRLESSPNPGDIQRGIRDLARDGKLKDGQRRVRLRNRGNTTSGGFSSKERIEQLFSPTSPFTFPGNQASSSQAPKEDFLRPRAETIRRLGSPFQPESAPRFPPRSPRHAPSLSDPFMNSSIKSQVHLHHQGEIAAPESRVTPGGLPYDPTEEGLTDAERIRRQILNLPYTKNSM